jgi:hypothetical protein
MEKYLEFINPNPYNNFEITCCCLYWENDGRMLSFKQKVIDQRSPRLKPKY